ncbi:glycosyltransferase [Membranicola marinus]|uniref:Glycosyltransferase n=1 Tax=Membranihabitans marinus TaxID=1227546 RepID=A0A953L9U7_9BACT|nr:glycosyltransferase [Membranihabitans marinus]MBY5959205.1 glycosyltransferase [Membranihabitans marinus]
MKQNKHQIFFMMTHSSHQNSTFLTSKKLSGYLYKLYYCGPNKGVDGDDLKRNANYQGFPYISLDPYSRTYCSYYKEDQTKSKEERWLDCFLFNLEDGALYNNFIKAYTPDLMIIDIHFMALAMPFLHQGIPVLLASTKVGTDKDISVPPLTSSLIPDGTSSSNEQIEKSWQALRMKNKGLSGYLEFLGYVAEERYQLNFNDLYYQDKCIVPFGFRLPELIFWDEQFDFPRTSKGLENKFYLGNQVDVRRLEKVNKFSGDLENNLIYISLGTRWGNNVESRISFLKEFIKAAKKLENFHFVVVVSNYMDRVEGFIESSNITLLDFAPQLSILSKSVLMINHGGGNSVKECIRMGVPMLCYPSDNDQFGNAARVVYHKVGLRGNYNEKDEVIAEKIVWILDNQEFKENIKKFQLRSIAAEESYEDVKVIEQFLSA